jgi:hypothetical protein
MSVEHRMSELAALLCRVAARHPPVGLPRATA